MGGVGRVLPAAITAEYDSIDQYDKEEYNDDY
jgi:hypothetical protein